MMTHSDSPLRRRYEDTVTGVKQMLDDGFDHPPWSHDTDFTPDPYVDGVWLVQWPNGRYCIAYLAGHATPWGSTRKTNDAEFGEE